jgi:hypothetical protein
MTPFIRVPNNWTPKQVELILGFIDDLHQAIWDQHGHQLCVYWESHPPAEDEEDISDDHLDDDLPL